MQHDIGVNAVAHVIQLAVAPVFLLSGIGAMLAVMTNRLARIVDRARVLEAAIESSTDASVMVEDELRTLARRAKLISRSVALCTATALLVCAVIVVLFLGAFLKLDTSTFVALLFITAMSAFFLGLLMFLGEIYAATANLRIGLQHIRVPKSAPGPSQAKSNDKTGAA